MSKTYGFGYVKDSHDDRDFAFSPDKDIMQALPPSVDLRPLCPPVLDQSSLGSCTANAIASAFEFDLLRQKLADFIPSRLFIYYYERVLEGTIREDAGASLRDGMKVINKRGVCPEKLWPYDISKFDRQPPLAATVAARGDKALQYRRIAQDLNHMKACLAAGLPFVFGITVYESFMQASNGDIPMPQPGEQVLGGHALLCVGYDDATQHLIFKNSWSTGWGNSGYGTIPYAYLLSQDASDFWEVQTVSNTTSFANLTKLIIDDAMSRLGEKLHLHSVVAYK